MDYKKVIAENIALEGISSQDIYSNLVVSQDSKNGEFCLPCFKFSKVLRASPSAIAEKIKANFPALEFVSRCEAVAGYVNFYLSRGELVRETIDDIIGKGDVFASHAALGKTVCIDYSSINIAKPFHIGHLLTTAIGGSLYRIYSYLGYKVVGINHLGDWGTQFGKLIVAYKKWGSDEDIEKRNIHALLELYVRFHAEAESDPTLLDEGRRWFKKIEDGDSEALAIFEKFKAVTLREVQKIYDRLGIKFDSYNGESFYNDKLASVVDELKEKNLLTESDGAMVVNLDEFGMPPCLILKSDGASLYATRDIAAALYRKKTYDFSKCLYVVAYQQNLHFRQVFKVLELMGYDWAKELVHVPFGMVSLEGSGALSTRKGNVVFLDEVLETAAQKAAEIIEQKNPNLENKESVAESVGVGAILFSALSNSRIKDMVFSYDKALEFEGETSPYIQYTHARCCSIISKCGALQVSADMNSLVDDETFEVVKILAKFDDVALDAAEKYEPSVISRFLIDLCQAFNKFYISHRITCDDKAVSAARLLLTKCVKSTLANGLNLLLIKAPTAM